MENKLYRHLLFWLASIVQGTLVEYAWIHTTFTNISQPHIITLAFCFNLSLMPSRVFFTYFALAIFEKKPFKRPGNLWLTCLKLGAGLLVAIIMFRMALGYYIIPHQYPGHPPYTLAQLFSPQWMLVALLDIGYVGGIALALKLYRMQTMSLKNEKELTKDKLQTELKFLKNQFNPHFLFNTMNNIHAMALEKAEETPQVVIELSNMLRYMLYKSVNGTVPISEEIKVLDNYVQLEKIRHNGQVRVCFKKEIDDYEQVISPLILLPFLENAFKHSNVGAADPTICVDVTVTDGRLNFKVKNPHGNASNGQINEHIGLTNIRRQLDLTYTDFCLKLTDSGQTFLVDLSIDLHSVKNYDRVQSGQPV
ncbi:MAG: sensor histidine kinase [Sphingobacteriales bacterium]